MGGGKKRPTVGRRKTYCRSPVTTYRGSSLRPTVGRFLPPSVGLAQSAPDSTLSPCGSSPQIRRGGVLPSPACFCLPSISSSSWGSSGGRRRGEASTLPINSVPLHDKTNISPRQRNK
ncbi:hypothetical protein HMPREF1556_00858 [Porphyromonas sp. oral taxon 278 str. W7784]|nr:hypothetical protein HMPREF1556_00858 [Porphyromonas sp. oral taxon 278 str. W7784]